MYPPVCELCLQAVLHRTSVFSVAALRRVWRVDGIGANTVHWNGQALTGVMGFVMRPVFGMVLVGTLTVLLGTACVVGLWIFSKFRPISLWARNVTHHAMKCAEQTALATARGATLVGKVKLSRGASL